MSLKRSCFSVLLAVTLAGCSSHGLQATGRAAGIPATASAAVGMDRNTYIKLSSRVLAEAVANNQKDVVDAFVTFADTQDPDPDATREIAKAGLSGRNHAELARIAAGKRHLTGMKPQTQIRFPLDEGAHMSAITEWWYVNGHLTADNGDAFGFEFTLFKIGPLLHWAHVAVTDQKGQTFSYGREWVPAHDALNDRTKLAVNYAGQALTRTDRGPYTLKGQAGDRALALELTSLKAPLLIGGNGKIDMPEGKDSWYYSLTRLATEGTVDGRPVKGIAWMDHQWGPFWVTGFADRWDWFSLQFDDNTEYNLFGFRSATGEAGKRHVNISRPDGTGIHTGNFTMDRKSWWQSPRTKLYYTTAWQIGLPEQNESAELTATNVDQELWRTTTFLNDPLPIYWEGSMQAIKTAADGKRIPGVAYCEHFGFQTPSGPRF